MEKGLSRILVKFVYAVCVRMGMLKVKAGKEI